MKIDCSKTVNFFDEYKRMCARENRLSCSKCPLSFIRNGTEYGCATYIRLYPNKAVEIVQKWSDEHEHWTYAEDFFEKFPNAPEEDDGTPKSYWCDIYGTGKCISHQHHECADCWNRIMEDKPND